jgi:hypothetical protein
MGELVQLADRALEVFLLDLVVGRRQIRSDGGCGPPFL